MTIGKCFELNNNINVVCQNLADAAKTMLRI